ncbi:hypothetical protein [Streptomyces sp. gb14]|uniref:hypothetical protein n=1 Tax=Streptomyces sp. gb14 TaxID=1827753 RepID=UPI000BEF7DFF|nr:hypothetical protein [Streptomyces sp. gb14]
MAEEKQNAPVWLGAAASALAVLAFFGVTNYDDLVAKVDPDSASRESCSDAYKAAQDYGDDFATLGLAQSKRVYGRKLTAVSEKTKDARLKELFGVDGEASVESAEATERLESLRSTAPGRARAAKDAWHNICAGLWEND